jgi:hypothetical protein
MTDFIILVIVVAVALSVFMLSGLYYMYQAIRLAETRVAV